MLADRGIDALELGHMKIFGERMPEVEQFSLIIQDLHHRFRPLSTVASSNPRRIEIERSDLDNLAEDFINLQGMFCEHHLRHIDELTNGVGHY